jgi:acetyl-CoA C-acetyltransferase/acetyl-CoA acyltransferase
MARNPQVDWAAVTDVFYGNANQAGEDNRNVAHMSSLLAGLPIDVPGATLNRLCGSGLDAVGSAARAIKSGEAGLMIAGGVESMSRAPFVMPKAETAFSRNNAVYDTKNTVWTPCLRLPKTWPPITKLNAKHKTAWPWQAR